MLWKHRIFVITKEEWGLDSSVAKMLLQVLLIWFNNALRAHSTKMLCKEPLPNRGCSEGRLNDINSHLLHYLPLATGEYYLLSSIRRPQFFLILTGNSSEAQRGLRQSARACIRPNWAPDFLWNIFLFHIR